MARFASKPPFSPGTCPDLWAGTVVFYYCIDRDWGCTDRCSDGADRKRRWEMRLEVRKAGSEGLFCGRPSLHAAKECFRWVSGYGSSLEDADRTCLLASQVLSESALFERRSELPDLRVLDLDVEAS